MSERKNERILALLGQAELLAGLLQQLQPLVHLLLGDDRVRYHTNDTSPRAGAKDKPLLLRLL